MSKNTISASEIAQEVSKAIAPSIERSASAVAQKVIGKNISRKNIHPKEGVMGESYSYMRAAILNDTAMLKDLGASGSGGYLVPPQVRDEILRGVDDEAEFFPRVNVVPVSSDSGSVPSLASDINVLWRSRASSENTVFAEADPDIGQVTWQLKRADAISKISRELVADSQPAVVDFITSLFRRAIIKSRDEMIVAGNGTTQPQGLSSASAGILQVAINANLSYGALVEIEQTLPRKYRKNSVWMLSGTNLKAALQLLDGNGRPIFERSANTNRVESRLLGYPVLVHDSFADDEVYFGDLSHYLWFDRGEMAIESTTSGGDAFASHQMWMKVWERADGKVALPEAFCKGTSIS